MIALFVNEENISGVLEITPTKTPEYYFKKNTISCIQINNNILVYYDHKTTANVNIRISALCKTEIRGLVIICDTTRNLSVENLVEICSSNQ